VPNLTLDQLTTALAAVAGIALLCLILVVALALRLRRVRKDYSILRGEGGEHDVIAAVSRFAKRVESLDHRIDGVAADLQGLGASGRFALQKFYIVRYDAFDDMGGRLSFSAAVLDDHGDGVVITSINGRTETRTYAKPIKGLASDHNLSEEERQAISGAAAGYDRTELQPVAKSR
jgi:Protein of unknown function (DUF4446)